MSAVSRAVLMCLSMLAAGQGMAQCPASREDALGGLTVTGSDGSVGSILRRDNGVVAHRRTAEGSDWLTESMAVHGVYPLNFSDRPVDGTVEDGPGWVVTYPEKSWPEPAPGLTWSALARKTLDFGAGASFDTLVTVQTGSEATVTIGDCTYPSLTVDTSMKDDGASFVYRERLDYLPSLGIALLREVREEPVGSTDAAEPRRFDYLDITLAEADAGGAAATEAGSSPGQCPTSPDDLDAGIAFSFTDGTSSVLIREPDGLIVERAEYNDGSGAGFYSRSRLGFALVELGDTLDGKVVEGTTETYEYPTMGLDIFDVPDTEATGYGTLRVTTFPDGERLEEEMYYRTRFFEDRDWGGCRYRVLPVHVSRFQSDDPTVEVYEYIPELGTAILTAILEGETPVMESAPLSVSRVATAN